MPSTQLLSKHEQHHPIAMPSRGPVPINWNVCSFSMPPWLLLSQSQRPCFYPLPSRRLLPQLKRRGPNSLPRGELLSFYWNVGSYTLYGRILLPRQLHRCQHVSIWILLPPGSSGANHMPARRILPPRGQRAHPMSRRQLLPRSFPVFDTVPSRHRHRGFGWHCYNFPAGRGCGCIPNTWPEHWGGVCISN